MLFNQANKKARRQTGKATSGAARKLYSVPVWLRERTFAGEFELGGRSYKLTYAPAHAEIADKTLQLRGRLAVNGGRANLPQLNDVRATLAGIQGGIGAGPARYKMLATGATPGPTQSPTEKEQKSGENEKKADEPAPPERAKTSGLPVTENTGPTGYAAVLFLHLEPLDAGALGVMADLSRVQLNARLAPADQTARTLHSLYSALTAALAGEQASEQLAAALVGELNRVLAG
jgi:hypothetical protein